MHNEGTSFRYIRAEVAWRSMVEGTAVSLEVVEKIAKREGTDPAELRPPLHTVINTEALDTLFQSTSTKGNVEFDYQGYTIRVKSSGEVQIVETNSDNTQTKAYTKPTEDTLGD